MEIDKSFGQSSNAQESIRKSAESDSNITTRSDAHWKKHFRESLVTEEGMRIDESDDERPPNAESQIEESSEPHSKLTIERDRQFAKQDWESSLTEDGIQIEEIGELRKAPHEIDEREEPGSNATNPDRSLMPGRNRTPGQFAKSRSQSFSIEKGIQVRGGSRNCFDLGLSLSVAPHVTSS
jgi:hypothetical protein